LSTELERREEALNQERAKVKDLGSHIMRLQAEWSKGAFGRNEGPEDDSQDSRGGFNGGGFFQHPPPDVF
jgi:hypothetical protein